MDIDDLTNYCTQLNEDKFTNSKQVDPATVVTAPWVRFKCQFGCPMYQRSYCCPPHTPTPEQTRAIIDSYHRAILIRFEAPDCEDRGERVRSHYEMMTSFEGILFKDGYYKALIFLSGPCMLCKECALLSNELCVSREKARPSMEACGIDVYQTARNNDFSIQTLSNTSDTQTHFCLLLVD